MTKFTKAFNELIEKTNADNGHEINYIIDGYTRALKVTKDSLDVALDKQLDKKQKAALLKDLDDVINAKEVFYTKEKKNVSMQTMTKQVKRVAEKVAFIAEREFNKAYPTAAARRTNSFRINDMENAKDIRKYIFTDPDMLNQLMNLNIKSSKKFENSAKKWCEDAELKCLGVDYNNQNFYFKDAIFGEVYDRNLYMIHLGEYVELYVVGQTTQLDAIKNLGDVMKRVKFKSEVISTWRVYHLDLIKKVLEEDYYLKWEKVIGNAQSDSEKLTMAVKTAKDCDVIADELNNLKDKDLFKIALANGLKTRSSEKAWDFLYEMQTAKLR